jgi:hypothetical protein
MGEARDFSGVIRIGGWGAEMLGNGAVKNLIFPGWA